MIAFTVLYIAVNTITIIILTIMSLTATLKTKIKNFNDKKKAKKHIAN